MTKNFTYILIIFITTFIVFSCNKTNIDLNDSDVFDRQEILVNVYDNIIIPAFNNLNNNLIDLENEIINFADDVSEDNLNQIRFSWINSYQAWQAVAMFNQRKAEEINYATLMNTYPCNELIINNNIDDSTYEIGALNSSLLGSTGFPAIGYLIYGIDSINILSLYTSNDDSEKRKAYLLALIQNMRLNTNLVLDDWELNRSVFINSTANTATSSLNILVNDFLQYFEKRVREAKIAIPSGVRGDLTPLPEQIESFYNPNICKALLVKAFNSIKILYRGDSYDGIDSGVGLEDYLAELNNTDELIDAINNQLIEIDEKINMLDNNFLLQLNNNNQSMFDVFYAMQTLVTYLKSDMLSYMNIGTDYMDNDGD